MKPELIIFSQNLLGGGASFHRNMINNKPANDFTIKIIYLDPSEGGFSKNPELNLNANDVLFTYGKESRYEVAQKLQRHISNTEGAIVTNLPEELFTLSLFPKREKTIYFICHDDGFIPLAQKYHYLIDVFIAHNYAIYETLQTLFPTRKERIYFIPHGVNVANARRSANTDKPLRIVFLARHHILKGIYDIPVINQRLADNNIRVEWTILGDGQERENFINQTSHLDNFKFSIPQNSEQVLATLAQNDIYILPSRKDGLPVSMLEAMSVGCVPIVSKFSEGIKKVVTSDIGYIIDVGRTDLFAETIAYLHTNRMVLEEKSSNAVRKIEEEYNIRLRAKQYFDLYAQYKSLKNRRSFLFSAIARRVYFSPGFNGIKKLLKKIVK
jgi:glycosyltransferase involved in cell wall biosynthesis